MERRSETCSVDFSLHNAYLGNILWCCDPGIMTRRSRTLSLWLKAGAGVSSKRRTTPNSSFFAQTAILPDALCMSGQRREMPATMLGTFCGRSTNATVAKMMSEFEFNFIVSGVDPHADDFADRFFEAGCDDATIMLVRGLIVVSFARQADQFDQAVLSGYRDIRKTGAHFERFEPDFLVSRSEIAKRANLSKAAISLYAVGERGKGFPSPCARITSSNPLWDWVEVADWLHDHEQLPLESVERARLSRAINLFIQAGSKRTSKEAAFLSQLEKSPKRSAFV